MMKIFVGEAQLPVNPVDDITIIVPGKNKRYELINLGEVTRIKDRGLIEIEFKSIFPKKGYPFSVIANPFHPQVYIGHLNYFYENRIPARFIVTGSSVDANFLVSIENFEYEERAGEEGECYYELELKEYREYSAKKVVIVRQDQQVGQAQYAEVKERPAQRETPREHVVVQGDTLWKIARSHLGKGERYPEIAALNNIKAPYVIRPGQRLSLPG